MVAQQVGLLTDRGELKAERLTPAGERIRELRKTA